MRRLFLCISIVSLLVFVFVPSRVQGATVGETETQKLEYTLFHLDSCPHCRDEIKFINNTIMPKYGEFIDLHLYEVSDPANQALFFQYGRYSQVEVSSVPVAFIGSQVVSGFFNEKTTGKKIIEVVEEELKAQGLLDNTGTTGITCEQDSCINLPVLGRIDSQTFSLPILTVIIGLLDGFNPCAMWVLLFLISLLLGMEDKRRMWLLGSIFIVASGVVYFIFMAAWLQLLLFLGMITIIRIIIGAVAIAVGSKNLRDFWKTRKSEGVVCEVSNKEGTKKTFTKIKDIVYRKSLWWSIIGIVLLGFSVNLVELACSAGFPAIFTQVLAINDLPAWQRYLYMTGYIFFYMLDDMIVFLLAMLTLRSKVVGGKYAKYGNLIGGLLIFILGILLIFRPEWLMFG